MEVYKGSIFLGRSTYTFVLDRMLLQAETVPLRVPDPLSLPTEIASEHDDADNASLGSFDLVDDSEPPRYICTECQQPYNGPFVHCYFCNESDPKHHGRCCHANQNRRQGHEAPRGRTGWMAVDLAGVRRDFCQLSVDFKNKEKRANTLAAEVSSLCNDKRNLLDEKTKLLKQLDDARCELAYERTALARLNYRNVIRDAAPPQHEHSSKSDRRLT